MKRSLVFMVCVAGAVLAASCSRPTTSSSDSRAMHARADLAVPASMRALPREPLVSNGVEGGREHAWTDDD
jgi:hypothetical protein